MADYQAWTSHREKEAERNKKEMELVRLKNWGEQSLMGDNQPAIPKQEVGDYGIHPDQLSSRSEKKRMPFILRVMMITCVQFVGATGYARYTMLNEGYRNYLSVHPHLFFVAFTVMLIAVYTLECWTSVARLFPVNYAFLALFSVAFAHVIAECTIMCDSAWVVLLMVQMTATLLTLTAYAHLVRDKYGYKAGLKLIIATALFISVVYYLTSTITTRDILYSVCFQFLLGYYFLYHTCLLISGRGITMIYDVDDIALGAMDMYVGTFVLLGEILKTIADKID
jgi:hypothetical protein